MEKAGSRAAAARPKGRRDHGTCTGRPAAHAKKPRGCGAFVMQPESRPGQGMVKAAKLDATPMVWVLVLNTVTV